MGDDMIVNLENAKNCTPTIRINKWIIMFTGYELDTFKFILIIYIYTSNTWLKIKLKTHFIYSSTKNTKYLEINLMKDAQHVYIACCKTLLK